MTNIGNLPDHVMLDILSLIPMNELILSCRLVCSRWRDLVDLPIFWRSKYRHKNENLKKTKEFYVFSHLERNLIKNPCGEGVTLLAFSFFFSEMSFSKNLVLGKL